MNFHEYGNNPGYYGYRSHSSSCSPLNISDPRVDVMKAEYFQGRRVLDIGCNTGIVTMCLANRFAPRSMRGCDIDDFLVRRARERLSRIICATDEEKVVHGGENIGSTWYPLSVYQAYSKNCEGEDVFSRAERLRLDAYKDSTQHLFPFNVEFKTEDYVESEECEENEFDTIVCLSTTKWIHLNKGDDGIRTLFSKVYRSLSSGGYFVVEPQPWRSYKKKSIMSRRLKENFHAIRIRPKSFPNLLEEIGFEHCVARDVSHPIRGFCRPVLVYRKK